MNMNIYVLQLENKKYYIGKTNKNVNTRFQEHLKNPVAWTKIYKPIKIIETFLCQNEFDEDNTTKKYMKKYGLENVRGGSYTQIKLESYQIQCLEKEFQSSNDQCFKCSKVGHFAKDCNNDNFYIINNHKNIKEETNLFNNIKFLWSGLKKLSRPYIPQIISDYDSDDYDYDYDDYDSDDYDSDDYEICSRCGRNTHTIKNCYATKHLNGKNLKFKT